MITICRENTPSFTFVLKEGAKLTKVTPTFPFPLLNWNNAPRKSILETSVHVWQIPFDVRVQIQSVTYIFENNSEHQWDIYIFL